MQLLEVESREKNIQHSLYVNKGFLVFAIINGNLLKEKVSTPRQLANEGTKHACNIKEINKNRKKNKQKTNEPREREKKLYA